LEKPKRSCKISSEINKYFIYIHLTIYYWSSTIIAVKSNSLDIGVVTIITAMPFTDEGVATKHNVCKRCYEYILTMFLKSFNETSCIEIILKNYFLFKKSLFPLCYFFMLLI